MPGAAREGRGRRPNLPGNDWRAGPEVQRAGCPAVPHLLQYLFSTIAVHAQLLPSSPQYLPNFFFGALLLWFGIEISRDWLVLSFRKLTRTGE